MATPVSFNDINKQMQLQTGIGMYIPSVNPHPSLDTNEYGATGYFTQSGALQNEYLRDLKGVRGKQTYNQMYHSDGLTKAIMKAIILPLLNASWYVEAHNEEDPEAILLAKKVENNLIHGLDMPWRQFLFQALLSLVFGFYIFEIIWKLVEDPEEDEFPVQVGELSPRHPTTITKWIHNQNGRLAQIEQQAYFNYGDSAVCKPIRIPYDKCLHFVNEPEAGNYEGTSIYRSQYKHWRIKTTEENFESVGVEKQALGMLIVRPPENYNQLDPAQQADIDSKAYEAIDNWRIDQHSGIYAPRGMSFEVVEGKINSNAIGSSISRHEAKMAQSSLAGFLLLGEKTGAYALSKDQTDFFLQALSGIAQDICDTINFQLIRKLIYLNDKTVKKFPRLCVSNIIFAKDDKNISSDETQAEDESPVEPEIQDATPEDVEVNKEFSEGHFHSHSPGEFQWRRTATKAEKRVNFAEIKKDMDTAEDETKSKLTPVIKKQIEAIKKQLSKDTPIDKIDVPFIEEAASIWKSNLEKIRFDSIKQTEKEIGHKSNVDKKAIQQSIESHSNLLARKLATDLLVEIAIKEGK
jgi:hypothetical protein